MIFRKGGNLARNISFNYDGKNIEIVGKFVYLGITFTTVGRVALLMKLTKHCLVRV